MVGVMGVMMGVMMGVGVMGRRVGAGGRTRGDDGAIVALAPCTCGKG